MSLFRRVSYGVSLLLICVCTAVASKPAPPPPPVSLAGLIYYKTDNGELWAMNPDGSNQTRVLPSLPGPLIPCFHPQGGSAIHDRWFLTLLATPGRIYDIRLHRDTGAVLAPEPHYDIYAFRATPGNTSQIEYVQLTDLFGYFRFAPGNYQVQWSNDSNDDLSTSFVGASGHDIRNAFYYDEDGKSVIDFRDAVFADLRVPMTAGEIHNGWLSGDFVPYQPAGNAEFGALLSAYNGGLWGGDPKQLNQDGSLAVGVNNNQVFLVDLFNPASYSVIWDGANGAPTRPYAGSWDYVPAWSRDETRIVVVDPTRNAGGGIWRLSTDGSPPLQLAKNSASGNTWTGWANCYWSPDSQHLMCNRGGYAKGNRYFRDIVILPGNGGAPVKEFLNFSGWPVRWVSASPSP